MKDRVKNIAAGIGYLALFFGVNVLVTFVTEFIYGFKIGQEIAATGGTFDQQAIVQGLMDFITEHTTLMTLVYQLLTLAIIWLIFMIRKKHFCQEVTLVSFDKKSILPILVMGVAVQLFVSYALELLPIPEDILNEYMQASAPILQKQNIVLQIIAVAVVAPIAEEVIFRGLILSRFRKAMPAVLAVILSSALFGLVHGQIIWMIYATGMGILFSVVAIREKSIGASVLLHMAINFSALFVDLIPVKGMVMGMLCAGAFVIIVAMLYIIVKKEKEIYPNSMND